MGISPFTVINTIWAACKSDEYVPDNVFWIINDILIDETDVLGLRDTGAVQQLLSVTNLLLLFRFKASIRLFFIWILNYWTAPIIL